MHAGCAHCTLFYTPPEDNLTLGEAMEQGLIREGHVDGVTPTGLPIQSEPEYDNFGDNILSVFRPFRPCARDSALYERGRSWVSEHKAGADRTRSDGEQLVHLILGWDVHESALCGP